MTDVEGGETSEAGQRLGKAGQPIVAEVNQPELGELVKVRR